MSYPLSRRILMTALLAGAALGAQGLWAAPAWAQGYPAKPIKLIVPYPAGGSTDQLARLIAVPMSKSLGQPVYVENISGGNTMIGTAAAKRAPADGYTLLVNSLAFSVNVLVTRQPPYRTDDFVPISALVTNHYVLCANLDVPADSLPALLDYARREPKKVNAASLGLGGATHLLNERLAVAANVPITSIHYRGTGPAMIDLLSGQVQFVIDPAVTSMPSVRAGKVKALAVSSSERSPLLPDVPTFKELGLPSMTQDSWFGVFAPKGVAPEIVTRLNREVRDALATPEVQAVVKRDGLRVPDWTPQQFERFIQEDSAAWSAITKKLDIQLD